MRRLALFAFLALTITARAAYEVGDAVADMCWQDYAERTICLSDAAGTVRVLLYNGGFCGPCNQEMRELAPRVGEFDKDPVTFLSLSAAGWSSGSKPDTKFLWEWKDKYQIPFPVLASPRDGGSKFGQNGIPNVAVLDFAGRLTYKEAGPSVNRIFSEIRKALGKAE